MSRRLLRYACLVMLALASARCPTTEGQEEPFERPPVAVEAVPVTTGAFTESVKVVGTLSPKYEAFVKAEYPGTVVEVFVTEWVDVKKGTPLARLDTREMEAAVKGAEAAVLQAEAQSNRAAREYERALNLKEVGLMTQQGVDDARTAEMASQATLAVAGAQLAAAQTRLEKAVLRAPMDGVVASREVSVGDLAGGDPVFRVVDTRLFDLEVTVPSSRIHAVKVGQTLTFTTDAVPGRTFEGKVAFINPAADPMSRTVRVVAEVANPDGALRADLFASGRILTTVRPRVLQVPRSALLNWDVSRNTAEVFVVEGAMARRRTIETGDATAAAVEVVSGLAAEDSVVTRGAFLLKDGDRILVTGAQGKGA